MPGTVQQPPGATSPSDAKTKHPAPTTSNAPGAVEARVGGSSEAQLSTNTSLSVQDVIRNTASESMAVRHAGSRPAWQNLQLGATNCVATSGIRSPQTLAFGAGRLDVGVFDGTHGWLRIRAELDGTGALSASLTASPSAHASLRSVLPEMVSYLSSEAISVSKIVLHRFPEVSSSTSASDGKQSNTASGNRNQEEQHPAEEKHPSVKPHQPDASPSIANLASNPAPSRPAEPIPKLAPVWSFGVLGRPNGNWLNVCA